MEKSPLVDNSLDFAIEIINLVKDLQNEKEFIMSNQIGKSGTSIGANIKEANYAQSRLDFISKMQIALKECNETEYWIELLFKNDYIDEERYKNLLSKCCLIKSMLVKSVKTAKNNV